MSDCDLRLLERAWRESGADADEAAFLRGRVRSGLLGLEALERAEVLGHAAATLALDALVEKPRKKAGKRGDRGKRKTRGPTLGSAERDHHAGVFWVIGLEAWGREACVRAAIALARLTLPVVAGLPEEAQALRAIEAAQAWVVDPSQDGDFLAERGPGVDFMGGDLDAARRASAGEAALDAATHALRAGFDARQIREALRAELVPWLLGYSDPVRMRVAHET